MIKVKLSLALCIFFSAAAYGQQLVFPDSVGWTNLNEGKTLHFTVKTTDASRPKKYSVDGVGDTGIQMDTLGNFTWKPSYDLVDRLAKQKEVAVIFQAEWRDGRRIRHTVTFTVNHTNRPPVVDDLPVFYVKQATGNYYQISSDYVNDPDGDPLVFHSMQSQMPEGANLNSTGVLSWTPSRSQFNRLKNEPITISFIVEDQPDKATTIGKIKVAQTQLDLPPEILLVPADSVISIKEDQLLNLKLYISDPNGDDDIKSVEFLSSDGRVPKNSLRTNTPTQAEFTWIPGYAFTDDGEKIKEATIIFFALDKSNNRAQRKVKILVHDAENIEEKDKQLYQKYRNILIATKSMIDRLVANQDKLNHDFKKAKRGRRHRGVVNISLGATTGLSPVLLPTNDSKYVSGIGGTAVASLGAMETLEIIGKSKTDIADRQKINAEIRNQLETAGTNFARRFALKSDRRLPDMDVDREKLLLILNDPRIGLLDLDASQAAYPKYENRDLKKTFPDFSEAE